MDQKTVLNELGYRVWNAMHPENHWRDCPWRWREESKRHAATAIRVRLEDAFLPWYLR